MPQWRRTKSSPLGRGSYGVVWYEECDEGSPQLSTRALKEIDLSRLSLDGIDYRQEISAMTLFSNLKHRDRAVFGEFYGYSISNGTLSLAMEYLPLKDLDQYIKSERIGEEEAKKIVYDLLVGLKIMHKEGIVHRDLKPENILVAGKPPESSWWVKIADFGMAKRIPLEQQGILSRRGTMLYSAPEALALIEPSREYPGAVDVWSLGIIVFQMATQSLPFADLDLCKYCAGVFSFPRQPILENYSEDGVAFVEALLKPLPARRLSAEDALQHPWITSMKEESDDTRQALIQVPGGELCRGGQAVQLAGGTPTVPPAFVRSPIEMLSSVPPLYTPSQVATYNRQRDSVFLHGSPRELHGGFSHVPVNPNAIVTYRPDHVHSFGTASAPHPSIPRSRASASVPNQDEPVANYLRISDGAHEFILPPPLAGRSMNCSPCQPPYRRASATAPYQQLYLQQSPAPRYTSLMQLHEETARLHRSMSDSFIPQGNVGRGGKKSRRWARAEILLAEEEYRDKSKALLWAIEQGKEEMAELAIDQGANVEAAFRNRLGIQRGTALHLAIACNEPNMVELLLERGAPPESLAKAELSCFRMMCAIRPLHLAAYYGNDDIVRMLIDRRAKIEANAEGSSRDPKRRTPLHLAVLGKDTAKVPSMVGLLLDLGASPDVKDSDGMMPGDYAKLTPQKDVLAKDLPSARDLKTRLVRLRLKVDPLAIAGPLLLAGAMIAL